VNAYEKEDDMPVQVIIKRKWQVDKPGELLPLLTELRSLAKKQPGYIFWSSPNGKRLTTGRNGFTAKKEGTFRVKWIL
jgi:antibiotic biosynthesis monooxygenase (ABM) superfamily enzyme